MTTISSCLRAARFVAAFAVFATLTGTAAFARVTQQAIPDRLAGPIDNSTRAPLAGSTPPRAMHSTDLGAVASDMPLQGISLVFSRSAAQQQDLDQLLAAQQNPASPQYHKWLTPAEFGARFGVSDNDLAATESWLQGQGFAIIGVSPSRDRITFSGPESAVESAFGTPLHYFRATSGTAAAALDSRTHMAPAHDLTLPASLSGMVLAVGNLSDYRPQSHAIKRPVAAFTSAQSGSYYLTPQDIATIYDIQSAYNAGYTGAGQTIVVAGQSAISPGDVSNFQTAAGVPLNPPTLTLVPNTGSSTTVSGDESESDLDVEYSSAIATKASVNFVYTGSNTNYGVFDSFIYAIEYGLGNIITISYGQCEPDLGQSAFTEYEAFFQQANAQGQTVINSAGDSGSMGCYNSSNTNPAYYEQVAVSYPASSAYVTALGGTEFPSADVATTNTTYFTPASGADVVSSAKSYIPEQAWNDNALVYSLYQQDLGTQNQFTFSPSSGGGGTSILESRPSWQSGVTGITSGNFRLVPDISLTASPNNAGFLYCSSDNGSFGVGFSGSCTSGFRVSSASGVTTSNGTSTAGDLTVAGGTSFDAPIFAGILAIINQARGYTTGQGNINPELYKLASNAATYATAFHDTPAGSNNACNVNTGTTICGSGAQNTEYATTAGYDEATGLGSIDVNNLIQAWPASTTVPTTGTNIATVKATPNTSTPAVSAADAITVQVSGSSGTPTGTVTVTDNGAAVSGSPLTLTNGAYLYNYTPTTACDHKLLFTYSGDANYAPATTTVILVAGTCSISLSAPAVTVASGSSTTETLTITPNGYTGTLALEVTSVSSTLTNACYSGPATVKVTNGTTPVTASYTLYTGVSTCPSGASPLRVGALAANKLPQRVPGSPWRSVPIPVSLAGLLFVGLLRRRSKLLQGTVGLGLSLVFVLSLGVAGLGLTGCSNGAQNASSGGGGGTTGTTSSTYSVGVTAYDTNYTNITSSATIALTVTN